MHLGVLEMNCHNIVKVCMYSRVYDMTLNERTPVHYASFQGSSHFGPISQRLLFPFLFTFLAAQLAMPTMDEAARPPLSLPVELLVVVVRALAGLRDTQTLARIQRLDKASYALATPPLYRHLRFDSPRQLARFFSEPLTEASQGLEGLEGLEGQDEHSILHAPALVAWENDRHRRIRAACSQVLSVELYHPTLLSNSERCNEPPIPGNALFKLLKTLRISHVREEHQSAETDLNLSLVIAHFVPKEVCIEWIPQARTGSIAEQHREANRHAIEVYRGLMRYVLGGSFELKTIIIETPTLYAYFQLIALYDWEGDPEGQDYRIVTPFPDDGDSEPARQAREGFSTALVTAARSFHDTPGERMGISGIVEIRDTLREETSEQATSRKESVKKHVLIVAREALARTGTDVDNIRDEDLLGPVSLLSALDP